MPRALRPVALAGLALLASTVAGGSALAQLECRVRFTCIGEAPCYYALFDKTGTRVGDFEVAGDATQYQTDIPMGTTYCLSRLGAPDVDCERQPINEDQFEC
jgi:hypothetical protein